MNRTIGTARPARGRALQIAAVGALTVALVFSTAALARPQASTPAPPCGGTAHGAPWNYKGQHGTAYTYLGVSGASCSIGSKYMPKWTRVHAAYDVKPVPAGWHCSSIGSYTGLAKLGQCTTTKGGIFEWLPKLKN